MISFSLAAPLHFFAVPGQDTAIIPLQPNMRGLCVGDIVALPPGFSVLVSRKTADAVSFVRQQEYRRRTLGGVAYRKWLKAKQAAEREWNEFDDYDEDNPAPFPVAPPAPRRARPLRLTKPKWGDFTIPAGATGVVMYSTFAEGALV